MIVLWENTQSLGNSFVQFQLWNQFLTSHIQNETIKRREKYIHFKEYIRGVYKKFVH